MKQSIQLKMHQLEALCDLLMAAAHADGEFDGLEAGEIADALDEVVAGEMPAELSIRLSRFDVDAFDMAATLENFADLSKDDKLAILALVTRIIEADSLHDLAEADFLRGVAWEMECSAEEVDAHTFEVEIITPPPVPKG